MKIGIVGGGISGLYCANLLEGRGHDVTIFENNKWGGDIQTTIIDGKCYPISTLFVDGTHYLVKKHLKQHGLDDYDTDPHKYIKDASNITHLFIAYIGLMLVGLYGAYKKSKVCMGLIVCLVIILLIILMPYKNIVQLYFYEKYSYPRGLAFGAFSNLEQHKKSYMQSSISPTLHGVWTFISDNHYDMPKNCGFYQLVQKFMQNKNINYIHQNIKKIERYPNAKIHTSDGSSLTNCTYTFDKIIIACGYKCYKNILPLTVIENKYLSNAQTFKFYSTIIKLNKKSDLHKIRTENDILGYFFLRKNIVLVATHQPIMCASYVVYKSYEWDMPFSSNHLKKQSLNKKEENILFIGKELVLNGVDPCMQYAKHVCDNFV